jgi:hypothetical protein
MRLGHPPRLALKLSRCIDRARSYLQFIGRGHGFDALFTSFRFGAINAGAGEKNRQKKERRSY